MITPMLTRLLAKHVWILLFNMSKTYF